MDFCVCTLFPGIFSGFFSHGILRKAAHEGLIRTETVDIRDFTSGEHQAADDRPFGGGAGMVMKPEPLAGAVGFAKGRHPGSPVVLLGPGGRVFDQTLARELSELPGLILVCGRYEGLDERFSARHADLEISAGDFILSGGEPAAMVVMDAVARLVPSVLGNEESAETESFETGLLEHGHYTRPADWDGEGVPGVLTGGNHAAIAAWREETALLRTLALRPDLLSGEPLGKRRAKMLEKWGRIIGEIIAAQSVSGPDAPPGDQ